MAMFTTSTGFPGSIPDAWFKKQILKFGELNMHYRRFAKKEEAPAFGKVWKANRYKRIELPMSALSEGVTPSDTNMEIEQVSLTATQYGIVVTLSDLIQLQMDHPVLQKGVEMVRDAMERLDNELICESLIAGTNVIYADATVPAANTSRADIIAADIFDTNAVKRAVNALEFPTDAQWGSAPRYESGNYVCILHRKHELDLLADSTWKDMAIRLDGDALKKGMINRWLGVEFYTTNFGPKFENLGSANAQAANTAAITSSATAGNFVASTAYDFKWTRRHKHRRFEEGISAKIDFSTAAANTSVVFAPPTNTAYVYTLYVGADNGTLYKSTLATNVVATTSVAITILPTSGDVAPVTPNVLATAGVYSSFVFGKDSYCVVDLQNMEAGISQDVRSDSDPLKQRRKIAAKFMEGSLILADNNLVRIEATSNF